MTWRSWDKNTRSKRAIAIDRALQAKRRYKDFNSNYEKSQNRSDVEDWDIKGQGTKESPMPKAPEPKNETPREERPTGELYIPTSSEKTGLLVYFHKMNPIEQFKDLQTTRNVVKTERQLEAWKNNPKAFDVQNIDTQPKGYIENRVERTRKFLNVPIWENTVANRTRFNQEVFGVDAPVKFKIGSSALGFQVERGKGYIFFNKSSKKRDDFSSVLAHELGHQLDFIKGNYITGGNINLKFNNQDERFNAPLTKKLRVFNSYFGSIPYAKRYEELRKAKKGEGFQYYENQTILSRAFRNDSRYRWSNKEQFAEFFSAFVTNPSATRKKGKVFYNIFTKGVGKEIHRELKQGDYDFLKGYIGGNKASSFKLF